MHSKELAPQPTEWETLKRRAIASTDMTLIYNVHATPEDARASVSHVLPDSVVFIEGYVIRKDEAEQDGSNTFDLSYEAYLNALCEIRLQHGKNHPDYQGLKTAILNSIDEIVPQYTPQNDSDFTLHSLTEIKELLLKDCMVFYADYRESPGEDDTEKMSEYNQRFRMLVQEANVHGFANLSGDSIGKTLRNLIAGVQAEMLKHDERELHAILHSLSVMGQLAALPPTDLHKSEDGRTTAYTVFGTAHARSLTHQFASHGMQPTVVTIEPLAEHLYLDALTESRYKNYRRRVGHVALSTLAYQLTHTFVAPALIADTYDHLAFLNEISQEERLAFLIACVHIQQSLDRGDRKTAEKNYFALLRSFMPRPGAFKPPFTQQIHAIPAAPSPL